MIQVPLLSLLVLIPFLGGAVALVFNRQMADKARYLALYTTLLALVIGVWVFGTILMDDDQTAFTDANAQDYTLDSFYFNEQHTLLPDQGVAVLFGVDGLSAPMVLLTGILGVMVILFAWEEQERPAQFFGMLMLLEASLFGVFITMDLFVFYIFWETVLIPMFFLIAIWGGVNRRYASIKFFIFTFTASMVMLVAIMALYFEAGGETFSMIEITKQAPGFARNFQIWAFAALFLGFAVKVPVVPWHTWLPDAHVQAPTAGSAWLAAVMLKMGVYGLIRLAVPMAPRGAEFFVPLMVLLATVSILYGALLSLGQTDLKKLVAYASISHMGICLLGIATLKPLGFAGAIFMMFAHGLLSPAMFMLAGVLQHRVHTRQIPALSGLVQRMPIVGSLTLVVFMGSLGLPGMAAFVAEFTVFVAFWNSHGWWLLIPVLGVIFSAAYHLWAIQRVFFGPLNERLEQMENIEDGSWYENLPVATLMLLAVLFGILPWLVMDMVSTVSETLLNLGGLS